MSDGCCDEPTCGCRFCEAVRAEIDLLKADSRYLGDLLARIHGDGGHHQDEHGTKESVRLADERVCELFLIEHQKNELVGRVLGQEHVIHDTSVERDEWKKRYETMSRAMLSAMDNMNGQIRGFLLRIEILKGGNEKLVQENCRLNIELQKSQVRAGDLILL